jgi:sporulation protein YlmC with PRC-barrel domain
MSSNNNTATLYTLGDRGQTVDGTSSDVRGRDVKDDGGESIGKVVDLLVDDHENKVRFLVVEHGGFFGFGEKKTLIPVDAVTEITEEEVFIDQSRERVASVPGYTPALVDDQQYHASIYSHYGYEPHWGPGYDYPPRLAFMFPPSPGLSSTIYRG